MPSDHRDGPSPGQRLTSLIVEVFKLNGRLIAAGDQLVKGLGLTSARWQVLGALALSRTPQTVADIGRAMGLTRQSVQRLTNELIQTGLLQRIDNPRHARAPLIRLTASGQKTYDEAIRLQTPWAEDVARAVPIGNIETATRVLRGVSDQLHARRSQGGRHDIRRDGSPRTAKTTARRASRRAGGPG
jgi:DNA-binding MarR family transcriptional regulator